MDRYPKRLIEVDLPIKRISAHARREKSIRHGHISTLHIWWARRPLAACRAVICAALWPDPADALCPDAFRRIARKLMREWAEKYVHLLTSQESLNRFVQIQKKPDQLNDDVFLRQALLDFIADFANWDNSTIKEYLETSRALTQTAHEALGGEPGTRPLVVDPFAGGGSIPLETLRIGADAFASDLNPVAVLLNKVVLEYIPKYGQRLADEVRKCGDWIKTETEKELAEFYPKDPDGATPIAYLWARTIQCEGPGCGVKVPLIRSLWLAKKDKRSIALQLIPRPNAKRVDFRIIAKERYGWMNQADPKEKIENPNFDGTVKRGSATCPCCGYTTPVARIREQLKAKRGGIPTAQLMCIVTTRSNEQGRFYRTAADRDFIAVERATRELQRRKQKDWNGLSLVPDERVNPLPHSVNRLPLYGMYVWGDVYSDRQLLSLTTIGKKISEVGKRLERENEIGFIVAVQTCLAFIVNKIADKSSTLCRWKSSAEYMAGNTFGRQALSMVFDYCETNVFGGVTGDISSEVEWVEKMLAHVAMSVTSHGQSEQASATLQPLPDAAAQALVTDPPYYDMISYADLSDFFYVWFRRSLRNIHPALFAAPASPKAEEIIVEPTPVENIGVKNESFYLERMTMAMTEARRVVESKGIGVVVFAHKSTSGWEAQLKAMIDAGWVVTGSWPIDTEMAAKLAGLGQARLASSVHLVCRPREKQDGSSRSGEIGDWRDILQELPRRIKKWMPHLAKEGIVGADAIFACLGPALEIYSRYSRVEKASGDKVELKEYLEQVWAAVAQEALKMIFEGADATGFEEDARLTAMWLWTLSTGNNVSNDKHTVTEEVENEDENEEEGKKAKTVTGYVLEYDAVRKIAQGLGAYLDKLQYLVEVKGDTARLLPVKERASYLFGKDAGQAPAKGKKKDNQLSLFEFAEQVDQGGEAWQIEQSSKIGHTVLDQLHQSMILFAAGRGDALKRFLVEDGVGRNQRFWKLAQALSALYPAKSDEKRWVDGVLARKKGLGL